MYSQTDSTTIDSPSTSAWLVLVGAVGGAVGAQLAERRGVAPRLGDEVPAEAEHVHPPRKTTQTAAVAEAQRRAGEVHEVIGHAAHAPLLGVAVAGGDLLVACLARVLRYVRRDLTGVDLAVRSRPRWSLPPTCRRTARRSSTA
jgi:hypothetical protein